MPASITNIKAEIEKLAGITTGAADTLIIESAQKYVVGHVSKDYLWAYASKTADAQANPVTIPVFSDSLLAVHRKDSLIAANVETLSGNTYNCDKVSQGMKGYLTDTDSLYFPTARHPKYLTTEENKVSVFPIPTTDAVANALYVDYAQIGDTSDLKSVIIFYSAAGECLKLAVVRVVDWTSLALPTLPISPDFGNALTISVSVPTVPSITKAEVDTTGWAVPTFTKPVLQVPDLPTVYWVFPASPVAPSLQSNSLADFDGAAPSFIVPVGSALDFTSTDAFIVGEDPEMSNARIGEIQAKIADFNAKLNQSQGEFNKENSIYQAKIQEAIQEAQLLDGHESRKLQKYQMEVSDYTAEVNTIVQENNGKMGHWNQEFSQKIGKFTAEVNASVNEFNRENAEFQATVQKSVQDAQLDSAEDGQKLQKFQGEVTNYTAQISRDVQEYTSNLTQKNQEYQANLAHFGQDMAKFQAALSQKQSETQHSNANVGTYGAMADKFYKWAIMELDKFIQNRQYHN